MSKIVAYANDSLRAYCQIKLDNGERTMISIASAPSPSIKIFKMALAGIIPVQTVWEYNPTMAGGYEAYVRKLMMMFLSPKNPQENVLDALRDFLLPCSSIDDVRHKLIAREATIRDVL
jgi:hypothetical protein